MAAPMKVLQNIILLHSSFNNLRRAISTTNPDRGVQRPVDIISQKSASAVASNSNKLKSSSRNMTQYEGFFMNSAPNSPASSKIGGDAFGNASFVRTDSSSTDKGISKDMLSKNSLRNAMRIKKLMQKRSLDQLRDAAKVNSIDE